jgi:hypothetical protein
LLFAYSHFGVSTRGGKENRLSLAIKVNRLLSDNLSDWSIGYTTKLLLDGNIISDANQHGNAARVLGTVGSTMVKQNFGAVYYL